MKTYPDCYSCFMRQALEAARFSGLDEEATRDVLQRVGAEIAEFEPQMRPPEMGARIHGLVRTLSGVEDPYRHVKERSTESALALLDDLRARVRGGKASSDDGSLYTAVLLAVIGNIMDYGMLDADAVEQRLFALLREEQKTVEQESNAFFQLEELSAALASAQSMLYVADNAGETVFDRVLLEEIRRRYPKLDVVYAVRGRPILNDATEADAREAGLQHVARLVSSGCDAPGTVLERCDESFLELLGASDLVLSKGQGNYESLSDSFAASKTFFLLMAKCDVVARDVGCSPGDVLLLPGSSGTPRPG